MRPFLFFGKPLFFLSTCGTGGSQHTGSLDVSVLSDTSHSLSLTELPMRKRSKVPYRKGKRSFSRTAGPRSVHRRNGAIGGGPLSRGGIRL